MARLKAFGATDIGRRRKVNEDSFFCDDSLGLFIVADGLGGHAAGEVASSEAIDVIHAWVLRERKALEVLERYPDDPEAQQTARRVVEGAVKAATYAVYAIAEYDGAKAGMGTTVSLLAIAGGAAVTAQVGDSRIYRVRRGQVSQLTDDHTLIAMQVRDGLLTPEQAARAPHRNVITRAVGSHDYVEVDTAAHKVDTGDQYLVCSDGLHGYLEPDEIPPLLKGAPGESVPGLIQLANKRGGKDNITAIVVHVT